MSAAGALPASDAGRLPDPLALFPLQSVLFPDGLLGLKVFEARYIDLVGRCLRSGEPFGVVCLRQGGEVGRQPGQVLFETTGTLAHVEEVDSEQAGILRVRCRASQRVRLGTPTQQADALWTARAEPIAPDPPQIPEPAMLQTVQALAQAISRLRAQGTLPFAEPFRLDDAGWVANRWCELLPVPQAAKQRLMELDDPQLRLRLVHDYLAGQGVLP